MPTENLIRMRPSFSSRLKEPHHVNYLILICGFCLAITGCQTEEFHGTTAATKSNQASEPSQTGQRFEFTRMIAHWAGYARPDYLSFVEEARPEVAQVGFYGAHFWSLAGTPFGGGYPANLPVRGHRECGEWFARL